MVGAHVAVVGAGTDDPGGGGDTDVVARAEAVGRGLAAAGATVVCGGLGGVMAAACRGAKAAGGLTVGILPGLDRAAANPWVDVAIATGLGEARNVLVVRAADVVVAVGGEYGTLSEIAFALKVGTPVVGLGTWAIDGVAAADGPDQAVAMALALALAAAGPPAGSPGAAP
jgi:uncharacterized protein (TIGR00725 family)